MKHILSLILFLLFISPVSSQTISSVLVNLRKLSIQPLENMNFSNFYNYPKLKTRFLPYQYIDNPALRYSISNLQLTSYEDEELNNSLRTLIKYLSSENIQYTVSFLKRYAKCNVSTQVKALENIQHFITNDSIEYVREKNEVIDGEEFLNTDLQTLVKYFRVNPNYVWLKKADRDSVFVELSSTTNTSTKFWMNNGQTKYYRFWAGNRQLDSIGTWIQVMPYGNKLNIFTDDDVFQTTTVEQYKPKIKNPIINTVSANYFDLIPWEIGTIKRQYWTYFSEVEMSMSQGTVKNWASGGERSLSIISNIRYFWNYNRNRTSWENWVHYRFGFMKNGDEDIRKNEDRFELNSKLGQKAFKHWYYTAQFNTVTQLFNTYSYPKDKPRELVANFMSPGNFTLSLGMDYKPNSNFSLVISPIAGKWTFVRDSTRIDPKRYGISDDGKRVKREAGAQLYLLSTLHDLFKIIDLRNELKLFCSYEEKYATPDENGDKDKCLPLTVNWKMTLDFKINYFMNASIYTETVYDESYSKKLQFKENLNLGVKFRF